MSALDDLPELKRKVEKLQRKVDKASGAYEQLMRRIKEEFGCKTLEQAESKLMDLQTQELESYKIYNQKKKKFEQKWRRQLEEADNDD